MISWLNLNIVEPDPIRDKRLERPLASGLKEKEKGGFEFFSEVIM